MPSASSRSSNNCRPPACSMRPQSMLCRPLAADKHKGQRLLRRHLQPRLPAMTLPRRAPLPQALVDRRQTPLHRMQGLLRRMARRLRMDQASRHPAPAESFFSEEVAGVNIIAVAVAGEVDLISTPRRLNHPMAMMTVMMTENSSGEKAVILDTAAGAVE